VEKAEKHGIELLNSNVHHGIEGTLIRRMLFL
jgi:hypothetical protein